MALDRTDGEATQVARAIAERMKGLEGPLLPILHDVQARLGCVPAAAIPAIAEVLNLTRAEVHGVVSFYHDFREAPAGRVVVRLCRSEACKAVGGDALAAAVEDRLAGPGVSVEPVYCLGLCACGPAAMVNGRLIGRASADGVAAAVEGA